MVAADLVANPRSRDRLEPGISLVAGHRQRGYAEVNIEVARYLNRVSDLIYVLARSAAGRGRERASH